MAHTREHREPSPFLLLVEGVVFLIALALLIYVEFN